ncbi:HPr kinase/phosphatase C-terminal domain-containing protein [Roseovarius sp. MBR-6]|uniref:HPr kinase/phosphorylase n=1 Tax=Roseovarius sp. MBR-6 TaxID=3156459 RepID=UPI003391890C
MTQGPLPGEVIHGSCVALAGRAVLIRGASGAGKSALALRLIALGAGLVADDRTRIWRAGAQVMADAPDTIRGLIEARGVGILHLDATGPAPLALVVDLDARAEGRLPVQKTTVLAGLRVPLVENAPSAHFSASILLYLKGNGPI